MNNEFEHIGSQESNEQARERKDWGVALGVSSECERKAFEIRDAILAKGVAFLTQLEKHPHITLFQGEFSTESGKVIESVIEEVLLEFSSDYPEGLTLEMEERLHFREKNNNVFWNVKQNEWLTRLHISLDEKLRMLPEWNMMQQFRDRLQRGNITEDERMHIQKYGVLSAGTLFLPHITIGKLATSSDFEKIKDMRIEPMGFSAENLLVGHIDRNGQIESLELSKDIK